MYADINLASKKRTNVPKKKLTQRLRMASLAFLFLVVGFSIVIFLLNIRYSTQGTQKQQTQIMRSLSSYNDTIAKIYLLNSRLTDIDKIINQRKNYTKSVETILGYANDSTQINTLDTTTANTMTISVSSQSLLDLNDFLNKVLASDSASAVKLTALRSSSGTFLMTLEMNI